jgi:hypothetical protein
MYKLAVCGQKVDLVEVRVFSERSGNETRCNYLIVNGRIELLIWWLIWQAGCLVHKRTTAFQVNAGANVDRAVGAGWWGGSPGWWTWLRRWGLL